MNIQSIFSSPLVYGTVDNLNLDLIENHCYDFMKVNKSRSLSNRGKNSYQSENIFYQNESNGEMKKLLDEIRSKFYTSSKELGIFNDLNLENYWININGKHSYNVDHCHPGSILSGVFYVKTPENSGSICFYNPISHLIDSYMAGIQIDNQRNYGAFSPIFKVTPQKNMLLIFPSWIVHRVEPNESDYDRISISFNFF